MKKICFLLLIVFCFAACGGGGDDSGNGDSQTRELALDETASDKIDEVGEVHMYHFYADTDDSGRTLSVNLSGTHRNSPVDFMLTIYRKDDDGNLSAIFGESAREDVPAYADINIDIPIVGATDLYMAVRDFKDDEASDLVSYRLTATYADETQPNDTAEDAIDLQVGADNCYAEEAIFPDSDEDYYRFTISGDNPAGVYRITVRYDVSSTTPIPVNLDLELYNGQGRLIQQFKGQKPADNVYVLLPYLEGGVYFLVVADQGRDDESQHHYSICIEPMNASEVLENDTSDGATNIESGTLTGSLEYIQDEDWYTFEVAQAEGDDFQIIQINLSSDFGGPVPDALRGQVEPAKYRISLLNSDQEPIHIYDQSVLVTEPHTIVVEGNAGTNYIMVKPIYSDQMLIAMPYQFTLNLTSVSDPGEATDPREITLDSDNNEAEATGIIYKVGDQDIYNFNVVNDVPKILEVYLDTEQQPSQVTYAVTIQYDGKTRVLRDTNGPDPERNGRIDCKTSFYLASTDAAERYVTLTVSDSQNNDADDVPYHIKVRLLDITESAGSDYFSEIGERNANGSESRDITVIEYNIEGQPTFKANTGLLRVPELDKNNQWHSPWITGFTDYDGDRDIFELNFDDITEAEGAPANWYFDIQIEIEATGSPVEYSWTLFRDAHPNDVLVERTFWNGDDGEGGLEYDPDGEGIVASWADMQTASNNIDVTIPSTNLADPEIYRHPFWIGNQWRDGSNSRFYLSIDDFNIANLGVETGEDGETRIPIPNQIPDNDWGNTNSAPVVHPYRFQVTVTYHPGESNPSSD